MKRLLLLALLIPLTSQARDNGQWAQNSDDQVTSNWIRNLMQPDHPRNSCCADADAYWSDDFETKNGQNIATITDDRDLTALGRPHRENGSKWIVPDEKMKWDQGNPTPHGWLFLSATGSVYCYVTPGGV